MLPTTQTTTTESFRLRQSAADNQLFVFKRPIVALSFVLMLMVVTVFFLFWRQATSVIETSEKLSKTKELVSVLDNTLSTLRDAESSDRGYVVTADPVYLKPYYGSRALLNRQLVTLEQLTSAGELTPKVSALEELMRKKVLEMDRCVSARTPQNFRDSWLLVVRGQGQQLMDQITKQIGAIKSTEEASAVRSANSVRDANRNILTTLPIILIVSGFMVALLVFFCFKFQHEKKLSKLQIARLNEDLCARIKDLEIMTAELEAARDEAMDASKLKSQFIANMSHEIRTPMSGVLGMSELLLEDESLHPDAKELVGYIHSSGNNLLAVVNDLLDFAKLEAGKVVLNDDTFSIEELLRDAVASIAPEANKKALVLRHSVGRDIPNDLIGDSSRLRQVILNLVHNAVKFTHTGTIDLSANLAAQSDGELLVSFEVRDTGIGITEEVQRKLFEPFTQADGSTTRQYGGTGLGLSICKSLVELMSGRIGVRSEIDRGSTFWFTVPLQACAETPTLRSHRNNEAA